MVTIQQAWNELLRATQPATGKESIRLANLAMTAALAMRLGLTHKARTRKLSARDLCAHMERLALTPISDLGSAIADWRKLLQAATQAAALIARPTAYDEWINAMQAADASRKSLGAYTTPTGFAVALAQATLGKARTARDIIDPSAGAGALLIAALNVLSRHASSSRLRTIVYGLHGVEIDPVARELCCHLIWLRAAGAKPSLERIANNISCANAITWNWRFDRKFDVLLMNPPWESLRHAPQSDLLESERLATVAHLESARIGDPDLPPLFSLQGTGDRNLAKAFLELAPHLIVEGGRLGALIPAAFASDLGMSPLRGLYLSSLSLQRWTSFENRMGYFPIDGRYKFGLLIGTKSARGTQTLRIRAFAEHPEDVQGPHFPLSRSAIRIIGGPSRMIPEVGSAAELRTLTKMFRNGTPLLDYEGAFGKIAYRRELDLTLDRAAKRFVRFEEHKVLQLKENGHFVGADTPLVPLVEGRMVGQFDCFQKSWVRGQGRTAQWQINGGRPLSQCRPQYVSAARAAHPSRVAVCDVTSATNTRTVHATLVPDTWWCGNTAPVLEFPSVREAIIGMAVLNSMVFDWLARRLVSGLHLNKFYLSTMMLPSISKAAAQRVLQAALSICAGQPRALLDGARQNMGSAPAAPINRVEALALIEREVATGYGLSSGDLRHIYSPDVADRRGFWRYFAAEPAALSVVQQALAQ